MIDEAEIAELLRIRDGRLFHREGQQLEFKEQFNFGGLADYFRDFAAFANNLGGRLIFGVKDSPRVPIGLSLAALDQFERIDAAAISGGLLETFSGEICWEQGVFRFGDMHFGVFQVAESVSKPVIAKKDEGRDQQISNGEIYYRYGGRTQRIQHAELHGIIERRVEQNNRQWLELVEQIGRAGPQNAAVIDTERGLIERGKSRVLMLDEALAAKIKFLKDGEFVERQGALALKLVGEVVPVENVEIVRMVRENLTRQYPLSANELAAEVKRALPDSKQHDIWQLLKDTGLKENLAYSAYNFRNKKQEDQFNATGKLPSTTPSIYNQNAVDFVVYSLRKQVQD